MTDSSAAQGHDRSYLERTIATVRNHRDADNCWPSWANIFADEIERLWEEIRIREESQIPVIPHGAVVLRDVLLNMARSVRMELAA